MRESCERSDGAVADGRQSVTVIAVIIRDVKQRRRETRIKMRRLDRESVVGNYLRLLLQRATIHPVQQQPVAAHPPSSRNHTGRLPSPSRVNVYLCIKQALFIRPMNMHCLVAVARCRVQTRRYHCLINHTQSHRSNPGAPPRRALPPLPRAPLVHSRPFALVTPLGQIRGGPAVSFLTALRVRSHSRSVPFHPDRPAGRN